MAALDNAAQQVMMFAKRTMRQLKRMIGIGAKSGNCMTGTSLVGRGVTSKLL